MRFADVQVGQLVEISETKEQGKVSRLDYDYELVHVDVQVRDGIDTIDVEASEIALVPATT